FVPLLCLLFSGLNWGRHGSLTKPLPCLRLQRIHEDPFYRRLTPVRTITPSASLRLPYFQPVGCPVTGSFESLIVDKGFQQQRLISIAPLPVLCQPSCRLTQNMRGQMRHTPLGHNQKPTVAHHLIQILFPYRAAPANPLVPRFYPPRSGRKRQPPQPSVVLTADQISQLCPT